MLFDLIFSYLLNSNLAVHQLIKAQERETEQAADFNLLHVHIK
jgi:hypothetical protein